MKALSSLVILCASLGWTQTAPPSEADLNKVIANFDDGTKMTLGEFQKLVPLLPGIWQDAALKDPTKFMNTLGFLKKEAAAVDSLKLADQSPYKQALDFAIMEAKARLYVQESQLAITVSPEEVEKYYNEHKEPFRQVKVSGLKVAFGGSSSTDNASSSKNVSRPIKKVLTEDEAKAKAEKLAAEIRGGADFATKVLTDSDDTASKEKGGSLGTWKVADNVPDDLRAAVLGLKDGEISDPIKQAGGYWIVHVDAVTYIPLDDVKDSIFNQVKQEKAAKWLDDSYKSVHVDLVKNDPPQPPAPSEPKK